MAELSWFGLSMIAATLLTWCVRHLALSRGWMDVPNARSSHQRPTPRGGGLSIVLASLVVALIVMFPDGAPYRALSGCIAGGGLVALVGYLDDRRGLPATLRFGVHAVAAAMFLIGLSESYPTLGSAFPEMAPAVIVLGVLGVGLVWSINLFNFMDGIDGIAGSQALFVAGASVFLASHSPSGSVWLVLSVATAGASAGFLVWNWPPARIFMGDVGSGFLGFWLGAIAVGLHVSGALPLWTSIILGAIFLSDATATLVRRMLRGEKWYAAHRSHAYQILTWKLGSHLKVTGMTWIANLVIVLPLAWWSSRNAEHAGWIAATLLAGMSVLCLVIGAGTNTGQSKSP